MRIKFLPKSRLGKWAAILILYFILASIFFYVFAEILNVIPFIIVKIFGGAAVIASIVAFITGVTAVIKVKERSILVYLAVLIGFIVILFIFGDILGLPDI